MKKKALLTPPRSLFWFSWKLLVTFSLALCILALISLHSSPSTTDLPSASFSRRLRPPSDSFLGRPKIAFLFLTRRNLPLDFLWGSFFENGDVANFSIYIHSAPGFVFDESTTRSHFFFGRQVENSIQVAWGKSSMIAAERLLLEAALEDPANQRFVLLSDSCVPLYNFSYIYSYLMASPKSFVDSFLDAKEGRYNPKMSPAIPKSKWRKGSQWISLIRSHAEVVVDDDIIFPIFGLFCKRRPPVDASKGNMNTKLQKQHNCIPDEHYVQTLLALNELEGELERRTVTYTLWNQSTTKMENKGWHPMTFTYANAGPRQIKEIKGIDHVYYETEFRTEWCRNNSTFVPCFLFARKFSQGAAMRLLSEGVARRLNILGVHKKVYFESSITFHGPYTWPSNLTRLVPQMKNGSFKEVTLFMEDFEELPCTCGKYGYNTFDFDADYVKLVSSFIFIIVASILSLFVRRK